ncbi:hypothetical protein [Nakamurella lactea]|uniref:hypothetical protein n=1 Tax=Nakamurella lactea TaxID=459515 RepID=UPI0004114E73|nr:hypothetical protein [Nakamurella lactea]
MTMTTERPAGPIDAAATRMSPVLLAAAGLLFAVYPAVRPYAPGGGADTATQFASPWWLVAHLAAVAGFLAVAAAFVGVPRMLAGSGGERVAAVGAALTGLGVGLTALYYGSEAFALHALGVDATSGAPDALNPGTVLDLADRIRTGGVAMTTFGAGLLLLGVGAVLVAVGLARRFPWWSGAVMALGFALFIPQFWAPPALRIGHGALLAVGLLLLAAVLRTRERRTRA